MFNMCNACLKLGLILRQLASLLKMCPLYHDPIILLSHPTEGEVKVVNLNGRPRNSKKLLTELHFDFAVDKLVVLQDSVLAFHRHGMQGRSFRSNEVRSHRFA